MSENTEKAVKLLYQLEAVFYNTKKQYIVLTEHIGQLLEGAERGNKVLETIHAVLERLFPAYRELQVELFNLTHDRVPKLLEKAKDCEILNKYCTCGGCYVDSSGTYAQCNEGRIAIKKLK